MIILGTNYHQKFFVMLSVSVSIHKEYGLPRKLRLLANDREFLTDCNFQEFEL